MDGIESCRHLMRVSVVTLMVRPGGTLCSSIMEMAHFRQDAGFFNDKTADLL